VSLRPAARLFFGLLVSGAAALGANQPPVVSITEPTPGFSIVGPTAIQLEAAASSSDSSISSVTYYDGTKKLATETAGPSYLYEWKNGAVGTHSLTAVAKDALGLSSPASSPVAVTVIQDQAPVVSLTAVPAANYGMIGPTSILLTATASSPDSEAISKVVFSENGTPIATEKGPAYTYTVKNLAAGNYIFSAVATDVLGTPGNPAAVPLTITLDQPPVVSIVAPASGYSVTGPAKIVLTATASSPDESIKSVEFEYQGPTKVATVTQLSEQGTYGYTWNKVPVGSYTVTAVATDNLGVPTYSSPISITVTQDLSPSISFITPISGAAYASPASIGLSATATSPDVSIVSVTYYQGTTTKLATKTTAPYLYTWKTSAAGTYSLTAVATDSVGGTTTSAPVTVTVAASTSTVKLTSPTVDVVAAPATVALAAKATASAGVAKVEFFAGGTLLGTSSTSPYQFTWTNASAGLYYLTAVETDMSGGSVTSAPIIFRVDALPVVAITSPASGSPFIAPGTINLTASATSASGTISKVEYFQGLTPIGTSTTAPFAVTWTGIPVGPYSVTAEAFDSFGFSAFSAAISVIVVTEMPPVISLTTPTSGLTFGSASNVSLSYNATASTSIARIEIYRNGALVATLTRPSSGSTWTFTEASPLPVGQYSYFARAYDSTEASTESAMATVTVAPSLPYLNDFEIADGFALGSLGGQVGWQVTQGTANVSTTAYSGSDGVQLAAGTPNAIVQEAYASSPGETIVFCDFYAMPTAESSVTSSTIFIAEGAEFGFQLSNGQGVLQVFRGNGSGGGTWTPTNFTIPLNSSNQAQNWVRLTARLDFIHLTWDIYANGNMIAYDIPFLSNTSTYFSTFQAQGDVSADSFFDDIYIGADNPLFNDSANDGINDAWKQQYNLPVATNDRYLNISGDGVPVIQDFINGTSPLINTTVTPPPIQLGLILDLRADAGVVSDSNGNVTQWLDQSTFGNTAFNSYTPESPQILQGQVHGNPALSFNVQDVLLLPSPMMQGLQSGEIIGVVELGNAPANYNTIWGFGTGQASAYSSGNHFDDFGTSDTSSVSVETQAQITQFYIYDTSFGSGTSIYRYNGVPLWTRNNLPLSFSTSPFLGAGMIGNIAEVLVYNRVLTDSERFSIGQYLTGKYAFAPIVVPSAPSDLAAVAVSSDTVDLSWTVQNPQTMHTVTTIERQVGSGSFVQVAQVNDASGYADTGLTSGTSYTYQITVQSYMGTSGPSNSASATTLSNIPDPPSLGLSLWLRSTVGTQGTGPVVFWNDQSGEGNNAEVANIAGTPQLVPNQVNGLPVVRFAGANELNLPPNFLQSPQQGEIIAVVKIPNIPNQTDTLWNFGTGNGTTYYNGAHSDDFGSGDATSVQEDPNEIAQYFVYDLSIDGSGNANYFYNGTLEWTRRGLTVGFSASTDIGGNQGGGSLYGDIAEIILYNRALSPQEHSSVYTYLAAKYGLQSAITDPNAPMITSASQVSGAAQVPFCYQITATNTPTGFGASTQMPSWLSIGSTGLITGTPPAAGTFTFNVTATNGVGTGSSPLTIIVATAPPAPVITSSTTAAGVAGQAFAYQILTSDYTASYSATGLPQGLTVSSSGLISGTLPNTPGIAAMALTATNAAGSGTASLNLIMTSSLVYSTGFEPSDGLAVGPLDGQNGWSVSQGTAEISAQDVNSGLQSLQLDGGTSASIAVLTFPSSSGEGIEYCDFYALPAAEASIAASSVYTVEGAQFGFQQVNGQGVLEAFYGNGSGGGTWTPTTFTISLGTGNQSTGWVRLTARLDFGAQTWDLYANGAMLAANIPFTSTPSTYLSKFQIQGDAGVATYIDDLYVGVTNPLFADISNDGISDAWKTEYGLSLTANDRNGDPTGGGVPNILKFIQGTSPLDYYNGIPPTVTPLVVGGTPGVGAPGPNDDLTILVLKPDGTPWVNAPATFQVTSGSRMVSAALGVGPYVSSLTVQTDGTGTARVYLQPMPSQ
jgi:Bacterial Ig domain